MPTYNYKSKELIAKVVYYGPGRCGKTTNLQQIHAKMRPETRSELLSVATETDRTIYFDLLPLNLGTISGMKFMVRLFTVPGQVYYSETRKLVLKGADGIVFVADSQDHMLDENRQSLRDLKENLAANGIDYANVPLVMQWNKRDLPQLTPEAELDAVLNERKVRSLPAIAANGQGVLETLRHITLGVFHHIKSGGKAAGPTPRARAPSAVSRAPAPTSNGNAARPAPAPAAAAATASASASAGTPAGSWAAAIPKANLPPARSRAATAPAPAPTSSAAHEGPAPVKISTDMVLDEFKNLAVMHSQMAERVSQLEGEVQRLTREHAEMREILTRRS
ncbi:MAG: GTPase domain-containing protein [Myxococcota bacterium]